MVSVLARRSLSPEKQIAEGYRMVGESTVVLRFPHRWAKRIRSSKEDLQEREIRKRRDTLSERDAKTNTSINRVEVA